MQQDPHTIACFALGVLACTVLQLFDDLQRVIDRFVTFAALDVHHCANATGIVLKGGVVKTLRGKPFPSFHFHHAINPSSGRCWYRPQLHSTAHRRPAKPCGHHRLQAVGPFTL
ncbi:hypothetical protein SDC9_146197 [bioreactor metagenome]|uniref:Uncharacterized protein n=1 Tax=bioreactor metagenome TaxID=1076179 RepID=A0A645EAN1_9ZZZZ